MSVWFVVHVTVHSTNTNSVGPPQCAQIVIYQLTSLTLLHESQETNPSWAQGLWYNLRALRSERNRSAIKFQTWSDCVWTPQIDALVRWERKVWSLSWRQDWDAWCPNAVIIMFLSLWMNLRWIMCVKTKKNVVE